MLLILTALSGLAAAFAAPIVMSNDDDDADEMTGPDPGSMDSAENILDDAFSDDAFVQDEPSVPFVQDMPGETVVQDAPSDLFVQDAPSDLFVQDAPSDLFVQDTLPEGEAFGLEAGEGTFEFEDFDPRVDIARIDMPDDAATIQSGLAADGTPEVVASLSDGSEMTLAFPGLAEVPQHAIEFTIPDEDAETDMVLSLAAVLELGADASVSSAPAQPAENIFVMEEDFDPSGLGALDDALDDLEDLLPVSPGSGDDVDELTDALDDLLPTAPGGGDDIDTPGDPLPDVTPVAPNPGDDTAAAPVAPGSGDDDADGIIPVPLPDGYTPVSPNLA